MKARVLPPEEWHRVNAPGLPDLIRYCEPQNIRIVVVEKDGEIVASVCALRLTHFEGLWITPEERGNAGVFRALIREAYAQPREFGETWVLGGAEVSDDKMGQLCGKLGGRELPVRFYAMPVGS